MPVLPRLAWPATPPFHRVVPGLAALGLALTLAPTAASAQAAGCADLQKHLLERKAIVTRLTSLGKKNVDPKVACSIFTALVSNGNGLVKFLDANQSWCQIPEAFAHGVKEDHAKAQGLRGKVCGAAAKQAAMQKRAREAQQQNGLLGGGGLEGTYRLPQGAL